MPSSTDIVQLLWLGQELESEGLPGLMAIAALDGHLRLPSAVQVSRMLEARRDTSGCSGDTTAQ